MDGMYGKVICWILILQAILLKWFDDTRSLNSERRMQDAGWLLWSSSLRMLTLLVQDRAGIIRKIMWICLRIFESI